MNEKEIIYNFISGKLQYKDFLKNVNGRVLEYLDKIYQNKYLKGLIEKEDYMNFPNFNSLYDWCISCGGGFFSKASLYDEVYNIIVFVDPNVEKYLKYDEDYELALDSVPEYLDGEEACAFIDMEIFSKLPLNLTKSEKKKFIKSECKRLFHIDGNKIPHWIQSCEWPIRNGSPCKYLKCKKEGDMAQFIFQDISTKEEIIIVQYF